MDFCGKTKRKKKKNVIRVDLSFNLEVDLKTMLQEHNIMEISIFCVYSF